MYHKHLEDFFFGWNQFFLIFKYKKWALTFFSFLDTYTHQSNSQNIRGNELLLCPPVPILWLKLPARPPSYPKYTEIHSGYFAAEL